MSDRTKALETLRGATAGQYTSMTEGQILQLCANFSDTFKQDAEVLYEIGHLLTRSGHPTEALEPLVDSYKLLPNNYFAPRLLVRCYCDMGQWAKALPYAKHLLALKQQLGHPILDLESAESLSVLGTQALYSDDWATASQHFLAVIDVLATAIAKSAAPIAIPDPDTVPPISTRSVHSILYLPVEIKARELEAKCLLALAALRDGFTVVIGRKWVLSAGQYEDLPPGVVLFKTLNGLDAGHMAVAASRGGHIIAAIDEEAFGRSASKRATDLNIEPSAVRIADAIYAQSQKHLDSYAELAPEKRDAMVLTGNAKIDLFKIKKTEATNTKTSNSPNILFCTMSGNINPMGRSFCRTMEQTLATGASGASRNLVSDLAQLLRDSAVFEVHMLSQFSAAVALTATKFPTADIVVRPHPVEDPSFWQDRFSSYANVRVETGGSLPQWLIWSDAMIYVSGCASGVEAALYDIPAIRFEGDGAVKDPDVGLSNALNHGAATSQDVTDLLEQVLARAPREEPGTSAKELSDYFYTPQTSSVSEWISSQIRSLQQAHALGSEQPLNELVELKNRRTGTYALKPFHLRKFPDTPTSEITDLISDLAKKFGLESRFSVSEIDDGLFLICPA